jgi:hypothetical protein
LTQDLHQQAKEAYDDAKADMHDQHSRMSEDLSFSNPADPKQWDSQALDLRKGRPCLTFDRTNQFIMQVVNDGRQNKPALHAIPADSKGDPEVADKLNGIFRHIEHVSRAGAAYDMMLEHQARVGLGWIRVIPQIMRPETNEQEIRIMRVHDPKSVLLQAGWTTHDGSDAMCGFAETLYSKPQFKALWPKHATESWEGYAGGWCTEDAVRICEYFKVDEKKSNRITAQLNGATSDYEEEDYWSNAKPAGAKLLTTYTHKDRKVRWIKMSGKDVLEETEFPSQFIPLIPALGYEVWIDGKRYLCGLTRRLMDGQRAYNYLQSALTESLALQPKAPFMVPLEGLEGVEAEWKKLNSGNPAYLPFNAFDGNQNPLPQPSRLAPPAFPAAFANAAMIASQDMEASVGMFKANLGQQGNETSGVAIRKREEQGDTANFHYVDNRDRAIERMGMVIADMIPRMYDTERVARIIGEDGTQDFVTVDPSLPQAAVKQGKKTVAVNLNIGSYDVRVKSGPAFASLREEQAEQLSRIMQSAPDLTPILADFWVGAQDFPESEKIKRRLAAMLPPQIQQMESEEGEEMSPEAMQQIQMLQAQLAEVTHALETAAAEHEALETEVKAKTSVEMMKTQADQQNKSQEAQLKYAIHKETLASNERIATLNAQLEVIKLNASAQQAQAANDTTRVLGGAKISADMAKHQQAAELDADKHASSLNADAQSQDKDLAAQEQQQDKQIGADVYKHETGLQAQSEAQDKDHQAQAQTQDKALKSSEQLAKATPKAKA